MDSFAYYGYLARALPPRRLAEALANRLWRQAVRPLGRYLQPPSYEAILDAFGVERASQLPAAVQAPLPGPLALGSQARVVESAAALRDRLPDEARRAMELASRSLDRRIRIFGNEVELPSADRLVPHASGGWRAIDWEADPVAHLQSPGHRLRAGEIAPAANTGWSEDTSGPGFGGPWRRPHAAQAGEATCSALPIRDPTHLLPAGSDPKMPWMVGRLEEVVHLACGAALCRPQDPTLAAAFSAAALDRMVDLASAPLGIQWSCTMEVALRAANIAIALRLLAGDPVVEARPLALLEVLRSLHFHVAWVQLHLEDAGAVSNNHLVADWVGILAVAALHPRLPGARVAARRASRGLSQELMAQTHPDGCSFEGSVGYHRLATELFLLHHVLARTSGEPVGDTTRFGALFEASLLLSHEDGTAPRIGDDDSGRALPFRQRGSVDLGWLPPLGAALLDRPDLNHGDPSPELLWLLGLRGATRLERLGQGRRPRDGALAHAGIYLLRSDRIGCSIACGPNGTGGLGTHGHNDKLSVEVRVDGVIVVGDPGSGSYTGDPALRNRLRGTAAHSTVQIDGREQQPLPRSRLFALPDRARPRCLSFDAGAARGRFLGEHLGYAGLGVIHRREVVLDRDAERLRIKDSILGGGRLEHTIEVRFLIPFESKELLLRAGDEGGWMVEIAPADRPLASLAAAAPLGKPTLEPALYARGYAELLPATTVVFTWRGRLPVELPTVLEAAAARSL